MTCRRLRSRRERAAAAKSAANAAPSKVIYRGSIYNKASIRVLGPTESGAPAFGFFACSPSQADKPPHTDRKSYRRYRHLSTEPASPYPPLTSASKGSIDEVRPNSYTASAASVRHYISDDNKEIVKEAKRTGCRASLVQKTGRLY